MLSILKTRNVQNPIHTQFPGTLSPAFPTRQETFRGHFGGSSFSAAARLIADVQNGTVR